MLGLFASIIGNAATGWLKNKGEKSQAKHTRELTRIQKDANWEEIQAKGSQSSWKDEVVTIIILTPVVLVFFPGMVQHVKDGFDVLAELPEYYQQLIFLTVGSAFGVKIWKTPWSKGK